MESFIPDLDQTESDVNQLLASLTDQRDAVQQGAEINRLRGLLERIDRQIASLQPLISLGLIPDSDPKLVLLRQKRNKVESDLEDLQVAAPRAAFKYAEQLEANPPSLDLPAVAKYQPHEVLLGEAGRRALMLAFLVIGMVGVTVWVGWQRLSATPRQGAYLSSPSESQVINQ